MKSDDTRLHVAMLSLHTSPTDQPGAGDSGGMNVYVRQVAGLLGERGVEVDVFTRCRGRGVPEIERVGERTRIIQAQAGPCASVSKEALPDLLPQFVLSVLAHAEREDDPYDLLHAHYWLSGRAGVALKERWGLPLVASFHTLGAVKRLAGSPEPAQRLQGERIVIREADRLLAPTHDEAAHLVELYGAQQARIRVVPPGVDLQRFVPAPPLEARSALGLGSERVVLFVGRLEAVKGPDLAIRAVARAVHDDPAAMSDVALLVVGGEEGPRDAARARLATLADAEGIGDRTRFLAAVPHDVLPRIYAAADVLIAPSRSESFGLAALEAQACGIPVIASSVGGLRSIVGDGETGFLVEERDPEGFASRLLALLGDPGVSQRMSLRARARAGRFSWARTADQLLDVYEGLEHDALEEAVAGGG